MRFRGVSFVLLALPLLCGGDCEGLTTIGPDPEPEPQPTPQDFGEVCIGETRTAEFELISGVTNSTATPAEGRALLTGGPGSGQGTQATRTGALFQVDTVYPYAPVAFTELYEFACVVPGEDRIEVEVAGFQQEDGQPQPAFVTCVDCGTTDDPLGDLLDSIAANNPTFDGSAIDLTRFRGQAFFEVLEFQTSLFEANLCNESTEGPLFVCGGSAGGGDGRDDDDIIHVTMTVAGPIASDPDHSLIYSVVFDSDGDPDNNWIPQPPFDWDLFQGADRWYQLIFDHTTGAWSLTATQVDGNQATASVPTRALAAVDDTTITFLIPADELLTDTPTYRVTAFGHDGAFSEDDRGADVSGANPTEPLLPLQ